MQVKTKYKTGWYTTVNKLKKCGFILLPPLQPQNVDFSKVHILRCDKIEKPAAREQHHFTPWDKHMLLYIFGLIVIKTNEQKKHFTIEQ